MESPDQDGDVDAEGNPYKAIINDLTLGEYTAVISSVPRRETLEDSQFEQAVSLREMGVQIPDKVMIDNSRLMNKRDIIKQMEDEKSSPQAQAAAQLQQRGQQADISETEAKANQKTADAQLKQAKTQETTVKTHVMANTPIEPAGGGQQGNPELEQAQAEHDADMREREMAHKQRMDMMEHGRKTRESEDKMNLQIQVAQQKRVDERAKAAQDAASLAAKPVANQSRKPTSRS